MRNHSHLIVDVTGAPAFEDKSKVLEALKHGTLPDILAARDMVDHAILVARKEAKSGHRGRVDRRHRLIEHKLQILSDKLREIIAAN